MGWAEGVPAEGHVVQALKSFPDRFDAGHRVDRAVHEAAQLADHPHPVSQGRRGLRWRFLLRRKTKVSEKQRCHRKTKVSGTENRQ